MSFRIASREALKSSFEQHRLGAVIVKGSRILATGFNSRRYSKIIGTKTLHAEASAVLKLLKQRRLHDLVGSEIYVTRYTKGGAVGMARPCSHCLNLLRGVGISRMHYTTDYGTTVSESTN